ncbi:lytic transglycosylase domain-containing protein [Antrihabitans spumae]|uniref:Lytic transglycosylase domain-containing protein n=1 Tax=Antrihabitans spumae TaxID=3373370 RepID=A0ABW7KAE6_9NOCA
MRLKAPITVSALVLAGLVSAGSSSNSMPSGPDPRTPAPLLAAAEQPAVTGIVGIVPTTHKPARKFREATPAAGVPFTGGVPLRDVAIPGIVGALGIPEIVLAAYRNAELALAASEPNCGVSWNLLAGIGKIESGHAGGGRTDAAGTTAARVLGPTLDGTLAGNNIISDTDGGALDGDSIHDRAVGPMQFIPGTWKFYASDGNGDGVSDPNNVFDATVSAAKYLCSGGLNLRDPAQELRAVLRYNNSMAYAANVLSWSAAYRTGGSPSAVSISPDLIPPGASPIDVSALTEAAEDKTTTPSTTPSETPSTTTTPPPPPMIVIPGLPPIPCGIFCPPPPPPPPAADAPQAQGAAPGAPGVMLEQPAPAADPAPMPAPVPAFGLIPPLFPMP